MAKRYDEAIEVTPDVWDGGAPLAFSWRGRRYEIDQRLMVWREAGEWWRAPERTSRATSERSRVGPERTSSEIAERTSRENAERTSRENAEPGGGPRDREYHRVLARPAGRIASGELDSDGFMRATGAVYDLYLDRITGRWRMARVWD